MRQPIDKTAGVMATPTGDGDDGGDGRGGGGGDGGDGGDAVDDEGCCARTDEAEPAASNGPGDGEAEATMVTGVVVMMMMMEGRTTER